MTGVGRWSGDIVGECEGGIVVSVAVVGVGVGDRVEGLTVASVVGTGVGASFNVVDDTVKVESTTRRVGRMPRSAAC